MPVKTALVRLWISRPTDIPTAAGMIVLPFIGLLAAGNVWLIFAMMKTAKKIDMGVPVTRVNAADLPAPDSLVRASQEPLQAQEGVLLRAATQTQDRHEEQLLRAAAGGQE